MNKNKKAFTLAEVLITLTIIGVIAAILFPSILANYNERTLKAKRQALVARMSQAMGEMADTFGNYESVKTRDKTDEDTTDPNCTTNPMDCVDNGSALKFINEGLSKVYKIAAVCDNETLSACDIPEEITRTDGTTFSIKDNAKTFFDYNAQAGIYVETTPYNLHSAGLITKNGESILLFYNPRCGGRVIYGEGAAFTESMLCVNMLYDLNGGKKKPNRMGEDIGFMTSFYNDSPYVVSPKPFDWKAVPDFEPTTNSSGESVFYKGTYVTFDEAKIACASLGENIGLPSREELMSMQINRELWAPWQDQDTGAQNYLNMWTSTYSSTSKIWTIEFISKNRYETGGSKRMIQYEMDPSRKNGVRCVYKD